MTTIKPPPHNQEMEQAVIGGMLVDISTAKLIMSRVEPNWFYGEANKTIYHLLARRVDAGTEADITLACQWLTEAGVLAEVGGQKYLAECLEKISTIAHTESYIQELRKLYLDRQLLSAVWAVNSDPSPGNIEFLRIRSQERDEAQGQSNISSMKDCQPDIIDMLEPQQHGIYDIFGMAEMDKTHNGQCPGDIITIGARPGIGKTVIAVKVAVNFAMTYNEPVLYFCTEMRKQEMLQRIMSPLSRVPGWKFRKRVFSKDGADIDAIGKATERLTTLPIFINDKPKPTIADIRAGMIKTKCKLLILDYIQFMDLEIGPEGRPAALGVVMSSLKIFARDLNSLVMVMSQMDREVDGLTGRQRPQLKDLKGSGDIEQGSQTVILLWKHNKKDEDKQDFVPKIDLIRPIEAIFAKNTHGPSEVSTQLIFDERFIEFREWDDDEAGKYTEVKMKQEAEARERKAKAKKKTTSWGAAPDKPTADPDEDMG